MNPLSEAAAQEAINKQILILVTSGAGDPVNCNTPGTYGPGKEAIVHSSDPSMAPTQFTLGTQKVTAAKPWSTIPQEFRDRMTFIHHSTQTNSHNNHGKVLRLLGVTEDQEAAYSLYARHLAIPLKSIQVEPISLNGVAVFGGRSLGQVSPRSLSTALAKDKSTLGKLQSLRDKELDRMYQIYKQHGTTNQKAMLDQFALSRTQARKLSDNLLTKLANIDSNGQDGQVIAAPILAAMNVSPAIKMRISFGGDNHGDVGLAKEAAAHVSGMAALNKLLQGIKDFGMSDRVTVASLNVFGRHLHKKGTGSTTSGRDHNGLHHCTFIIGKNVKAGVIGSLSEQQKNKRWAADPINSQTGVGGEGGDIDIQSGLGSVGKTLGAILGIPAADLDKEISEGKLIKAALKS